VTSHPVKVDDQTYYRLRELANRHNTTISDALARLLREAKQEENRPLELAMSRQLLHFLAPIMEEIVKSKSKLLPKAQTQEVFADIGARVCQAALPFAALHLSLLAQMTQSLSRSDEEA